MKQIFTLAALFFSLLAQGQTIQKRDVGSFSGISVASGVIVEITKGMEETVTVSSSNDLYTEKIKQL